MVLRRTRQRPAMFAAGLVAVLSRGGVLAAAASADSQQQVHLGEVPLARAKDVGFTQGWGTLSEKERLKLRAKAGWKWEFPHEGKAYHDRQEERTAEIMDLYHYQERLDNWVQYTQIRSVKNFTELGFAVVQSPPDVHARLKERLHAGMAAGIHKEMGGKPQGIFGDNYPDFVQHGERRLLEELQPIHEEWAAAAGPLRPVTAYGMRVYRRGASLGFHADRVDTHIISSIFHIDHAYDDESKPWPIEIEGHDGKRHAVALKPGEMLLYESAKCPHGRSTALEGEWYASVFCHFSPSPEAWPYSQQDVWLAVPGGWDDPPITHSGEGRWAGAFLTHDSMAVVGMVDRDPRDLHASAKLRGKGEHTGKPEPKPEDKSQGHYEAEKQQAVAAAQAKANARLEEEKAAEAARWEQGLAANHKQAASAAAKAEAETGAAGGEAAQATRDLREAAARAAKMGPVRAAAELARQKKEGVAAPIKLKSHFDAMAKASAGGSGLVAAAAAFGAAGAAAKAAKEAEAAAAAAAAAAEGGGLAEEVGEAVEVAAYGVGAGLALYFLGGGTFVGLCLLLRRAYATRGRSLARGVLGKHAKVEAE